MLKELYEVSDYLKRKGAELAEKYGDSPELEDGMDAYAFGRLCSMCERPASAKWRGILMSKGARQ